MSPYRYACRAIVEAVTAEGASAQVARRSTAEQIPGATRLVERQQDAELDATLPSWSSQSGLLWEPVTSSLVLEQDLAAYTGG